MSASVWFSWWYDQLSASVWFVLLVVANGGSSRTGVHCIGVQVFHDTPTLLQSPLVRVQFLQVSERQQCTRQRRQKEAAYVPVWMTDGDATYGNSIKS